MILSQFNTLRFYPSNTCRIYEYTHNPIDFITCFVSGYIPSIQLIVSQGSGAATLYLMNELDEVQFSKAITATNIPSGLQQSHTKLINIGTIENDVNLLVGNFYIRISYNGYEYDSDMFKFVETTTDLIEISATSSDIEVGNFVNTLTNFTYKAFYKYESKDVVSETEEESEEKEGFKYLMYGTTIFKRSILIYGDDSIYRFLTGLRILSCNGNVLVTVDGITYNAKDIVVAKDGEFPYTLPLRLEFKDRSESISVLNSL